VSSGVTPQTVPASETRALTGSEWIESLGVRLVKIVAQPLRMRRKATKAAWRRYGFMRRKRTKKRGD
jgi:hypothetical protein